MYFNRIDVTRKVENIFGKNVINHAYIINDFNTYKKDEEIDLGHLRSGADLVIEFVNGKKVEISNSRDLDFGSFCSFINAEY